jgi:hypothetical protein
VEEMIDEMIDKSINEIIEEIINEANNYAIASVKDENDTKSGVNHLTKLKISFNEIPDSLFNLILLGQKTQDRRIWKESHGKKMQKCIGQIITATRKGHDFDIFLKNIYPQKLSEMSYADVCAEGLEDFSPQDFINQFFDGDDSLIVWVIDFEVMKEEE